MPLKRRGLLRDNFYFNIHVQKKILQIKSSDLACHQEPVRTSFEGPYVVLWWKAIRRQLVPQLTRANEEAVRTTASATAFNINMIAC